MNLNQTVDNVNDVAQAAGLNPDFYLQTKFGDVYAFDGIASDSDVSNGYYGVVQEIGSITDPDEPVIIKGKGEESLKFTQAFTGIYQD